VSNDLVTLGEGGGSKNEALKLRSNYLRGPLVEELQNEATFISEDALQLLKFHGSYQQDDRDLRAPRKAAGLEKAYSFMLRSRIPGGRMTPAQYLVHDQVAGAYGNGTIRLTTRQSIQLHGVIKKDLKATIASINHSLLSTLSACGDVNRNVMACPAPHAGSCNYRIQEIAHAIAMHLAPRSGAYHEIWLDGEKVVTSEPEHEPIYGRTYLPRKFKIGIAYPGDNCIDIFTQDIGLVAEVKGTQLIGFTVLIGGGMGMTHNKPDTYPRAATPLCFVEPNDALALCETIVTVQRDYGDRKNRKHARMKYLVEEQGVAWFREQVESRLGRTLADPPAVHFDDVYDHVGWSLQPDGKWFLGLFVENGRIKDAPEFQLRTALRTIVSEFQTGVRITAQQNLLLTDIADADRAKVEALLNEHGVVTNPDEIGLYRYAMACPAMPTCGLAVAESERALPAVVAEIERELVSLGLGDAKISIRMTGCPNGCARPYMGDIGFVGRSADLYDLFIGGDWENTRLNKLFQSSVKTGSLVATLRPLFALWKAERATAETFGDYAHRVGFDHLREATLVEAS